MLASLLALACAVYFAILAGVSLRDSEVARFLGYNLFVSTFSDAMATINPELRSRQYISRRNSPVRFWIAIVIRCLIASIALFLAIWFFVAAVDS
jgi:hypothetical protein